jgi:hypothetical protein
MPVYPEASPPLLKNVTVKIQAVQAAPGEAALLAVHQFYVSAAEIQAQGGLGF